MLHTIKNRLRKLKQNDHWLGKSAYILFQLFRKVTKYLHRNNNVIAIHYEKKIIYPDLPKQLGCDYFFWAMIDWHFRFQRPQHLAQNFARLGHRVFYFSNEFIDHSEAGFEVENLSDKYCLHQIKLYVKNAPAIYSNVPSREVIEQIQRGLAKFLQWAQSNTILSIAQHPFWLKMVSKIPNSRFIYDCMDHHGSFYNTALDIVALEKCIAKQAELLIVTSSWLQHEMQSLNSNIALIRNATDHQYFSVPPALIYRDKQGRRILGYYGALSAWFDTDLVEKIAKTFSDCLILLIGADTFKVQQKLRHLTNVKFIGEVNYEQLPYFLHAFDVCMLPFKICPLTLATNPVKIYEYLSAGKSVVSVDLPEIHQFENLVAIADTPEKFINNIKHFLAHPVLEQTIAIRKAFAAKQTWQQRIKQINAKINELKEPLVSIIVVTYNNLSFTRACLESLIDTDYTHYEVIIVDNASTDDSPVYLTEFCAKRNWTLILNTDNRGFSAANNQGLNIAKGEYLVILNNDTIITQGWLRTLVNHMRHNPTIGLIGPITNNIGNEARVEMKYHDIIHMPEEARKLTSNNIGKLYLMKTLAFFCVMLSRQVYEKIGGLDEVFGLGFFEDDDYCRRVEQIGLKIVCARDVFIHHHLSASFNKLPTEEKQKLFAKNKAIYEKKWGEWVPHQYFTDESLVLLE